MSVLDGVLAAWAFRDNAAVRRANYLHRRLLPSPLALVPWHLGGEPFSIAALGYGRAAAAFDLAVPGQALNRERLFAALLPVAEWFNAGFEEPWSRRRPELVGKKDPKPVVRAPGIPQVVVPNAGAVKALGRLGRRLAYLPTIASDDGPPPASPVLVRFGQHLLWLTRHARQPGQQLLVDTCGLVGANWATPQTPGERANLAAVDAWVEPVDGLGGFNTAFLTEDTSCGPIPDTRWEHEHIAPLVDAINEAMGRTDTAGEAALIGELATHYRSLTAEAWSIMWRCLERERCWPEEPRFVPERVDADRVAYSEQMAWMDGPAGGRRRTRENHEQAFRARRVGENAAALVEAQEAVSDPVRLIHSLVAHQAVAGTVVNLDRGRKVVKPGKKNRSAAPLVTLRTTFPCLMAKGKALWWAEEPGKVQAVVTGIAPDGTGSLVTLEVTGGASFLLDGLSEGGAACFSVHSTKLHPGRWTYPSQPFTHTPAPGGAEVGVSHLEPEGG